MSCRDNNSDIEEAVKLYDASNAMTYSRIVETERCVYVARQYLYSSLYDRIRYTLSTSISETMLNMY